MKKKCEYTYEPCDRIVVFNDNDPNLIQLNLDQLDIIQRTYRYYGLIPPKDFPKFETVEGYGLPPEQQMFQYEKRHEGVIAIEQKVRKGIKKELSPMRRELTVINGFWAEIDAHPDKYKDVIAWINLQWYYRLFGKFFFNNGKLTYITGSYWDFLNSWSIQGTIPRYRDRDRRWQLAVKYTELDTTTFAKKDKDGKGIPEPDGTYKMIDLGMRVWYGMVNTKVRRAGDSSKSNHNNTEYIARMLEQSGAIQGKDDENASEMFTEHVVAPLNNDHYPIYFKPLRNPSENLSPKNEMAFKNEENYDVGSLKSKISHATSSDAVKLDMTRRDRILIDEAGKCFGIGTPILMYDGSVKRVEDVVVGDFVMGWDSTPRKVLSLGRGREMMYRVIPNKGNEWRCNESHILAVKTSAHCFGENTPTGTLKTITIPEYTNLYPSIKRSLVLFRKGVDFSTKDHTIPPYLLGIWLGDGNHCNISVCSADKEIKDYMKFTAQKYNMDIRISGGKRCPVAYLSTPVNVPISLYEKNGALHKEFDSVNGAADYLSLASTNLSHASFHSNKSCGGYRVVRGEKRKNALLDEFRDLNLIGNKYIPTDYICDSEENRLELLAGLIDTDGHLDKREHRYEYEIIQVRKELAEQIWFLANSLGFYSSIHYKKTSMKRSDGTMYYGEAYRVMIYGKDLYRIPCKIKRKKINIQYYEQGGKGRNPLHTGFSVVPDKIDDYYGFTIDGDHLFLLGDFTVVHNTSECDVVKRHGVIKYCLSEGSEIRGHCLYPTTCDTIEDRSAGERFMQMCFDSMWEKRDDNGQTGTGLCLFHFRATDGLHPYIDQYGMSMENEARRYIEGKIAYLKKNKKFQDLADFKRQHPILFKDNFSIALKNQFFNKDILETREQYLNFDAPEHRPRKGMFVRKSPDGDVIWVDDPEGISYLSIDLKDLAHKYGGHYLPNQRVKENGIWSPVSPLYFVASFDTFSQDKTQGRASNGGGAIKWMLDKVIDPDIKDKSERLSCKPVWTCSYRPETVEEYVDQMIMACQYFNAMCYPENNVKNLIQQFIERGYGGYLLYDIDPNTGHRSQYPGWWHGGAGNGKALGAFNLMRDDIALNGARWQHPDLLVECLSIIDPKDMTNWDLFTSYCGCLMAEKNPFYSMMRESFDNRIDSDDFMAQFLS